VLQRYWIVPKYTRYKMKDLNKNSTSIKNWATDDRPREKMQQKGSTALSNAELLAILINNGNKEKSALALAQDLLLLCDNNLNELHKMTIKDFVKIKGIGPAKAITIAAALELGKRRHMEKALAKKKFERSSDVADYLKTLLQNEIKEHFVVLYFNAAINLLGHEIISHGSISQTLADPRLIFKLAMEKNATRIIVCHNHPSGSLSPSEQDKILTYKLREGGKLLQIELMDHIIVSEMGYYSFADNGEL
jgi:DNA repair protein RadC